MKKFAKPFSSFIFAILLFCSCNTGDSDTRDFGAGFVIVRTSMSGIYFENAYGEYLIPDSQSDLSEIESGDFLYIQFLVDSVSTDKKRVYVCLVNEYYKYNRLLLTTYNRADTIGTDPFSGGSDDNSVEIGMVKEYLITDFYFRASESLPHTIGLAEESQDCLRNDTLFFRLWHNGYDDKNGSHTVRDIRYFNVSHYSPVNTDSLVIAVTYTGTIGVDKDKTIYTSYKP